MEWRPAPIERRKSRQIKVGSVLVGGLAPISVQSMTSTDTMNVEETLSQVKSLENAGADIVRVTVPTLDAVEPFARIVKGSVVPIVADIHFDYRIAIECAKKGAAALRINPGNIGSHEKIDAVCSAAKDYGLPIRVGVNAGSLDKDLLKKYGAPCPDAMVEAALRAAATLDEHDFYDYAFSVKASELNLCVEAYEKLSKKTDAPLHLGITEAGGLTGGTVLSSIGISWLLKQGIGDTIRVSLAADPVNEIKVGFAILKSMHLRSQGVDIVACPTCGRRGIDVVNIVTDLEHRLLDIKDNLKIAVMGCVVNGPGEAKHADIAVCGAGNGMALVYEKGQMMGKIPNTECANVIEKRIRENFLNLKGNS